MYNIIADCCILDLPAVVADVPGYVHAVLAIISILPGFDHGVLADGGPTSASR